MSAVTLLADLTAAGLTLALDPPDNLLLRGDPSARARWLPAVRENKGDLVLLLSERRPEWLGLTLADLQAAAGPDWQDVRDRPEALAVLARLLTAPADKPPFAEMLAAAKANLERIERDYDERETRAFIDALVAGADALIPREAPALVACRTCTHWRRDLVGDGSGLGRCMVQAPASKRRGSLWPRGEIVCRMHLEVTS